MDESEANFSFDSLEMKDEAKKLGKMRMTISFRTETPDEVLNLINFPAIQVLNSSRMQQIHRLFSWHRHWVRDAFIKFANFQFNARITRRFHIKLLCAKYSYLLFLSILHSGEIGIWDIFSEATDPDCGGLEQPRACTPLTRNQHTAEGKKIIFYWIRER